MAIYKENMLKDIYGIVRKGSVQFEPGDYVPIKVNNKGKDVTLLIGGVHYDDSVHDACYDLYTENHEPVYSSQPWKISNLTPNDLCELGSRLEQYSEYALRRHMNYTAIEEMVGESENRCIRFERESEMPRVMLDDKRELRIASVFSGGHEEYLAGVLMGDRIENMKLAALNDKTIMNIAACMKVRSRNIKNERSAEQGYKNYFHM